MRCSATAVAGKYIEGATLRQAGATVAQRLVGQVRSESVQNDQFKSLALLDTSSNPSVEFTILIHSVDSSNCAFGSLALLASLGCLIC